MTATLERPAPAPAPPPSVAPTSRMWRWWAGWRVALRLARRDAWRAKGRSLLVVLLIALPVAVVTSVYVFATVQSAQYGDRVRIHAMVGDVADAWIQPVGGTVYQAPNGNLGSSDGSVTGVPGTSDPVKGDQGAGGSAATLPSQQQLLAALPPGTRLVPVGTPVGVTIEDGAWGVSSALTLADVRDPMNAGRWHLASGRLPAKVDEVALSNAVARRLHVGVGATVTVTALDSRRTARLTVVGTASPLSVQWTGAADGVTLPAALGQTADPTQGYLAAVPRPLIWADVRAVNRAGGSLESLPIYDAPPSFCRVDQICLDDRGATTTDVTEPTPVQAADAARKAAEGAVIVVLVVLQIALLAGPAFAVQLRRRQRELGLVSASGGSAAVLRRTMLASGVVLGLVGAVVGLVVGWGAVWFLGGVLPWWSPLADTLGAPVGVPPFPPELLAFALVGMVSAMAAAAVPAVMAGRGDVIDALKGQRPLPPVRRRTPIVGVVMAGVGLAITAYATAQSDPLVLGVGVIVGELGLVLLMPWLVVQLGRPAARLPVSLRIAVRDSGRHRMRTAAAACAVMAAAAAAVAASTWAVSSASLAGSADRNLPEGVVVAQVGAPTDTNGVPTQPIASTITQARSSIDGAVPGARTTLVRQLVPAAAQASGTGMVTCTSWPTWSSTDVSPRGVPLDQPCSGRSVSGNRNLSGVLEVQDVDALDQLLGPLAPLDEAKAALRAGKALVLTPHTLDPQGRVWLQAMRYDEGAAPTAVPVPGMEVLTGAFPSEVIVGPAALEAAPLRGLAVADPSYAWLLVAPASPDTADQPTTQDRITLAFAKAGLSGGVSDDGVVIDPVVLILGIGAVATLLLALIAGLMVTALALADGRADLQTLAAVGGPPRVRRRFAAASAGFVTGLGCLVGAVSGLAVAWVLLPLVGGVDANGALARGPFVVPWATMALVVVAVPLLTSAVAGATTRSRIALTRRPD
jgi:putative ABC transport system permease protein